MRSVKQLRNHTTSPPRQFPERPDGQVYTRKGDLNEPQTEIIENILKRAIAALPGKTGTPTNSQTRKFWSAIFHDWDSKTPQPPLYRDEAPSSSLRFGVACTGDYLGVHALDYQPISAAQTDTSTILAQAIRRHDEEEVLSQCEWYTELAIAMARHRIYEWTRNGFWDDEESKKENVMMPAYEFEPICYAQEWLAVLANVHNKLQEAKPKMEAELFQ